MSAPAKRPTPHGHRRRSCSAHARIARAHAGVDRASQPVDPLRDRGEQRAAGA
ncbi:uncharacterized protein SOCEGT47_006370 [Sorangium cellulosum]|uniref:Uncharacterized protein n=1 Tax=Sorangium cellulosum TaxID=56 RepID=A0A4P2PUU8_SORCE|nr:uncharacterized protein SOCEGT47_006370 [Sorangium cellulosum]